MVRTPQQGDIIKINLDPKQGHEQKGYRPYLCLSNRIISETSKIAVFAPISNTARNYPFYYSLENIASATIGKILLDQLVAVDYNARSFTKVEAIDRTSMKKILAIAKLIFEENMTNKFMQAAIDAAFRGMEQGLGGPFGAAIVRGGEIIACEHNRVLSTNDPTMHAEVAAIRAATAALGRFSLHDCEIYATCMPCPMCLGAIMWAKIPRLYYGATAADAAAIGFDDDYIYNFIRNDLQGEKLSPCATDREACLELFTKYEGMMY